MKILAHRLTRAACLWAATLPISLPGPAAAADQAPARRSAPPAYAVPYSWNGFYVGAHFGYGGGGLGADANAVAHHAAIFPTSVTGFIGGYQAGYNFHAPNNFVFGIETDLTFVSPRDQAADELRPYDTTFNFLGTARGRVGYARGFWLPYVTGGLAFGQTRVAEFEPAGDIVAIKAANHWAGPPAPASKSHWPETGPQSSSTISSRSARRPTICRHRCPWQWPSIRTSISSSSA